LVTKEPIGSFENQTIYNLSSDPPIIKMVIAQLSQQNKKQKNYKNPKT
jgi:hypothetical protein